MRNHIKTMKYEEGVYYNFLSKIKSLTIDSSNAYEQATHFLIIDLEELLDNNIISKDEFTLLIAKAFDVIFYFRCDLNDEEIDENYRAAVIHQIGCGMLQALHILRPELRCNNTINESAYNLYQDNVIVKSIESERYNPRPTKSKDWLAVQYI